MSAENGRAGAPWQASGPSELTSDDTDNISQRGAFLKDQQTHQGWFRVEEEALRHLKRTFAVPASYRKASAAYITLLRISNLRRAAAFDERIGAIADDMGYSYNDAAKALQLVKLAGLCEIETRTIPGSKERDKSVYIVKRMLPANWGTLPEKEGRLHEKPNISPFAESSQEVPQEGLNNDTNKGSRPIEVEAEILEAWNKTDLTKCQKLTEERRRQIHERLKSDFWRENWRAALEKIAASPFCRGETSRGWTADIDWFIRSDDAVAKALEGKYGAKPLRPSNPHINDNAVWSDGLDIAVADWLEGNCDLDRVYLCFEKALQYITAEEVWQYIATRLPSQADLNNFRAELAHRHVQLPGVGRKAA